MNKKVYSLLTTLMLSLAVLVGCSNQDVNTDKKTDTATNDAKVEEKADDTKDKSKEDKDKKDDDKKEESKNDSEDEKAEITFWHAMGGGQGEALESLVADFEKEHPNIKVNLQNQGNYGDLNQILVATMQSPSDLPTITQAYPDWMLQFEDANLVTDLTDMVKGEDGIEDYDDILPGVREEIEQDGKIMGLPLTSLQKFYGTTKLYLMN